MNANLSITLCMLLSILPFGLRAHTQAESNEVARLILLGGLCNEIDDYTENETHPVLFTNWNGFIGGDDVASGWTAREKEAALICYMSMLSTNDCRTLDDETKGLLRVGLAVMQDYNYTNALPMVSKWMVNPYADSIHRLYAVEMYYAWANVDQHFLTNTELLLTNTTWVTQLERIAAGDGATETIRRNHGTNQVDVTLRNAAVNMLYRTRYREVLRAVPLDRLFVDEIPGYEFSSNRLQTITGWLNSTNRKDAVPTLLTPITNRLMQSSVNLVTLPNLP